jgi:hypothetical protein
MQHTIPHSYADSYHRAVHRISAWKKFIQWADSQQKNWFGWSAFAITGHGTVFTILTSLMVLYTGNYFIFWPFVIAAMAACVVVNLVALPTKITIPVFFFSLLTDLVIILICLTNGFSIEASFR